MPAAGEKNPTFNALEYIFRYENQRYSHIFVVEIPASPVKIRGDPINFRPSAKQKLAITRGGIVTKGGNSHME